VLREFVLFLAERATLATVPSLLHQVTCFVGGAMAQTTGDVRYGVPDALAQLPHEMQLLVIKEIELGMCVFGINKPIVMGFKLNSQHVWPCSTAVQIIVGAT
jgi:DUF917 family protein